MARSRPSWIGGILAGLLFWVMFAVGITTFGTTLLIPVWLDYVEARERHAATLQRNATLELQRTAIQNQLAHHRSDDFYNARYAETELNFRTPYHKGRYTLSDLPDVDVDTLPTLATTAEIPELIIPNDALREPQGLLAVFVLPQVRPAILGLSAIMILGSLIMLSGQRGWAPVDPLLEQRREQGS